jgi:hypothetical protein
MRSISETTGLLFNATTGLLFNESTGLLFNSTTGLPLTALPALPPPSPLCPLSLDTTSPDDAGEEEAAAACMTLCFAGECAGCCAEAAREDGNTLGTAASTVV